MFRASLLLVFVALACGVLCSQRRAAESHLTTCAPSQVHRADGWRIPGLAGAAEMYIKSKELYLPGILPPPPLILDRAALADMPGVFMTRMQPGKYDLQDMVPYCLQAPSGQSTMYEERVRVQQLWRFDYNGKVFAYALVFTPVLPLLEFGQVVFYDLDGKGAFTVARKPKMYFRAEIEVPKWAKEEVTGAGR